MEGLVKRLYFKYAPQKLQYYVTNLRAYIRRYTTEPKQIKAQQAQNRLLEKKLKGKKVVHVSFFILDDCVWKYDGIYRLMEQNERFEPTILICPTMTFDENQRISIMDKAYSYFKDRGYRVLYSYDKMSGTWLDVRTELKPDIIFYGSPYDGINRKEYYVTGLPDILSCYITYGYILETYQWVYNLLFHNLLWLQFSESEENHQTSCRLMRTKGTNTVLTGYPLFDLLCNNQMSRDVWKIKDREVKRIIWAPHHSIDEWGVSVSTFLSYHAIMLEIAEKYKDRIQIAFKPHPLLKQRLYLNWGKERTDAYYSTWEQLENGQFESGEYLDLFLGSDAIIHDCMTFTIEYLYTLKPALYLDRRKMGQGKWQLNYNQAGQEAYRLHYHAYNSDEIYQFLEEVILENKDTKYPEKRKFFDENLRPPHGKTASENIMDILTSYL